jgi:hypothetical protein
MPWSPSRWPAARSNPLDVEVFNEVRAALRERDDLVPAGYVAETAFARWEPIRGEPEGAGAAPYRTVANFQYEIEQMLGLVWPYRWWDAGRNQVYAFADLCQDAFGQADWTRDLTGADAPWTPAAAGLFDELQRAVNRLDRVRILPTAGESFRHDSVYRLTFGIQDWAADRADTFALFDGTDDGAGVGLAYDVGLGAELYDDGFSQQWFLDSRRFRLTFATGGLTGHEVAGARLEFATEAPGGSADYADTFTAEVADAAGQTLEDFLSDDYGAKAVAVPAASINTEGDTVFTIRSARPDSNDRPEWTPPGPNYTSTYREGLAVAGPVRLIVEVAFEYHG